MIIRPVTKKDLGFLKNQRNRPEIMKYFRQYNKISDEEQKKWFNNEVVAGKTIAFIIEYSTQDPVSPWHSWNESVGYCSLSHIDTIARKAEFSIFVIPEYQNIGIGKSALNKLIDFGFNKLNLNTIYSEVIVGNKAINLYKRIGFKICGRLSKWYFKEGKYLDSELIILHKDDKLHNRK